MKESNEGHMGRFGGRIRRKKWSNYDLKNKEKLTKKIISHSASILNHSQLGS